MFRLSFPHYGPKLTSVRQTQQCRSYAIMDRVKKEAGIQTKDQQAPDVIDFLVPKRTSLPPSKPHLQKTYRRTQPRDHSPENGSYQNQSQWKYSRRDASREQLRGTPSAALSMTTKHGSKGEHRLLTHFKHMESQKAAGMHERLIMPVKSFTQPENPHLIRVAIIGAPNAGKSTLVNKMIGEEVSIVSSKSHTTRERVLAILSQTNHQVIFLDTPGIISPKSKEHMNRSITTSSWRTLDQADYVLIMVDGKYATTKESQRIHDFMLERLSTLTIPATLVFNKMDALGVDDAEPLKQLSEAFKNTYKSIENVLYISALEEDGIENVKEILFRASKPQPWVYPPGQTLEMAQMKRVEELIRVEFFKRLHRYIPYMLKQENTGWIELKNGGLRIEQNVYVERASQHKIVVGANGMIINRVVEDARAEISKAFNRPIQLIIQVKTRNQ